FESKNNEIKRLKELKILKGEIIDATFMSVKELRNFYEEAFQRAKERDLLISLHLKATMMKVSDPVIFGHAIEVFFKEIFSQFGEIFSELGVKAQNGLKDIFTKISTLDEPLKGKIFAKFDEILAARADLAMVNFAQNITNFHFPNDVIIDASMPAMIRNSGKMRNKSGELKQTLAVIPDRTYASLYEACIDELKANGTLDPKTIGSVSNVGLMAKKAEEYGSHDKTFIANEDGEFIVLNEKGNEIFKFNVEKGDIFRMTQTKDDAVKAWIKLAFEREVKTKEPLIFWLDGARAHDLNLIKKFQEYSDELKAANINFEILSYDKACKKTLEIIRSGKNVIGVTGNVLRDYLTDLFPILELGTSSKMLSIVPLLSGGAMFETGAGGTAPMLAKEFLENNHLDWDSLGEYLALIASLERLGEYRQNENAKILSKTLNAATAKYLKNNKSPKNGVKNPDTRASHFYIALYWSEELARNGGNLASKFKETYKNLADNEVEILKELCEIQGTKVDFGGYFMPDETKVAQIMRPSKILNQIIG
ncbi:MAG: NADP-dependent isocitrate dehydrogenase, partial [Campylobacter sp.]|nr:NADP-dependent isocitrate dehydrogenase [Campylobacter sp.]